MKPQEIEFLRESNAIEGVYDDQSLKDAIGAWQYLMTRPIMTMSVILETHRILMVNQAIERKYKGSFRDIDVYIGGQRAVSPSMIESLLLMQFVFETMRAHPTPDWQHLHVVYERIHPFVDGNGRTGRMFMNWTRVNRCQLGIMIIHEGKEQQDYYKWFNSASNLADESATFG